MDAKNSVHQNNSNNNRSAFSLGLEGVLEGRASANKDGLTGVHNHTQRTVSAPGFEL